MRVLVSDGSSIVNVIILADGTLLSAGQFLADDYPGAVIGTPIIGSVPAPKPGDDYDLVDGVWVQVEALAASLLTEAKEKAKAHLLASLRRLSSDVALELLTDSNLQAATALAVTAIKSTAETAIEASVDRSSIATVLGGALTKLSSLREAISSEDVDAVSALAE